MEKALGFTPEDTANGTIFVRPTFEERWGYGRELDFSFETFVPKPIIDEIYDLGLPQEVITVFQEQSPIALGKLVKNVAPLEELFPLNLQDGVGVLTSPSWSTLAGLFLCLLVLFLFSSPKQQKSC